MSESRLNDLSAEDFLRAALADEMGARRIAAESADRFRDVLCDVLGLDVNPGDDALVKAIRAKHGKSGPEPRRWRNFCAGAVAHMGREGFRWVSDLAPPSDPARSRQGGDDT